jgi:hypothetical protein
MKTIATEVGYCSINQQEKQNGQYFIIFSTKDRIILMKKGELEISKNRN